MRRWFELKKKTKDSKTFLRIGKTFHWDWVGAEMGSIAGRLLRFCQEMMSCLVTGGKVPGGLDRDLTGEPRSRRPGADFEF